jgi:hypothetical protein
VPTAIPMASVPTSRKEIRRRVRRQVMLRRLSRELGRAGNDADSQTVLRRPFPTSRETSADRLAGLAQGVLHIRDAQSAEVENARR